jgi:hypothetical protein
LRISESEGPPDPADCTAAEDVGSMHHDVKRDVWYECFDDSRTSTITWSALPSE